MTGKMWYKHKVTHNNNLNGQDRFVPKSHQAVGLFSSIHAIVRVVSLEDFCTSSWLVSIHTLLPSLRPDPFQKDTPPAHPGLAAPRQKLPWRPPTPMSTPPSTHVGNGLTSLGPPPLPRRQVHVRPRRDSGQGDNKTRQSRCTDKHCHSSSETFFFPFSISAFVDFWVPNKNLASLTHFSILHTT